jgi:hypothetical protein
MKRFAAVLMTIVFVMAAASVATAQKKCEGPGEMKVLTLEPGVKTAVQKLELQFRLDTIDLKAEQMKLHDKMTEELMKDDPSVKTLDGIFEQMSAVHAKMHKVTVAHLLAVKKVLPKDHWAAYLEKHHGGCAMGGGCMNAGMEKGCCQHGPGCTKGGCCTHGGDGCTLKAPAKAPGCEGHAGAEGCAVPCVKVKK